MTPNAIGQLRVAVLHWIPDDGIRTMLCDELLRLGHTPLPFQYGSPVPDEAQVLLSFGPYGPLLPVWQACAQKPAHLRPTVVHWNTEGMPDLRLPPALSRLVCWQVSRLARGGDGLCWQASPVPSEQFLSLWQRHTSRFRYNGDYEYAYRQGWLHVLADTSSVYAQRRNDSGIPTTYAPWGTASIWNADLRLERDIDVLWMGARSSARRSRLLDRVCRGLIERGVNLYLADNIERPFIFHDERTYILNRAKITLNLTRTWYDDNFSRFALAAPNRSLVISEPLLRHCPEFEAGVHYVSADIDKLVETIVYYLRHEQERRQIVDNAYELATTKLVFRHSLERILASRPRMALYSADRQTNALIGET